MELRQLRCFAAVAEELHFGRAAERLHMLPSALGRQVRLLEEELGAPLLLRTTRHVALTPAGNLLLREAREILARAEQAARAVREMARAVSPVLRIGAIDSAAAGLLPELLYAFHARHPEIPTELMEGKSSRLLPLLVRGRLDLGLVRPPVEEPGIVFEHLLTERPVAALPSTHPLAARRRLRPRDLEALPLILPPRRTSPHSAGIVARLFDRLGLEPHVVQEADEKQTMVNLVAARIGVALLPEWMARIRVPGVVYRPLDLGEAGSLPEWALGVAWAEAQRSPGRDAFLALLRERFLPAPAGNPADDVASHAAAARPVPS
ncbi:LysR substrate-binding domain-containing protein [Roseomonas gilardii]|uniref:LysR substrate-binding domain-containing protein n=1 Tax=Roseomonas gilardii TaxID=257708 RepID=UPI0011A404E8|nr:LysR substrate-binding domain-containing protein [Roseomonas gilardii]